MTLDILSKAYLSFKERLKFCLVIALWIPILDISFLKSGLIFEFIYELSDTYTIENYLSIFIYDVLGAYLGSIMAVYFHSSIILNQNEFRFFSKSIFKYFIFCLFMFSFSTPLEYLMGLGTSLPSLAFSAIIITVCLSLFLFLFFLWSLYLPNLATQHKYGLWFIIKNSKGFRLTMVYQMVILTILILLSMITLLLPVMGIYLFLYFAGIVTCYGICMLSQTYLLWEESLNLSEVKNK